MYTNFVSDYGGNAVDFYQRILHWKFHEDINQADIAEKMHVARATDFHGIELGKDCVFGNDLRTSILTLPQKYYAYVKRHQSKC